MAPEFSERINIQYEWFNLAYEMYDLGDNLSLKT